MIIRIEAVDDGFYVEDGGTGLPPTDRDHVFEPGFSTTGGPGLGLVSVRQIVLAHGWEISATDGQSLDGARFEITDVELAQ